MDLADVVPFPSGLMTGQGLQFTLQFVDRPGLFPVLVHGQDDAAVLQFLVDLDVGRGDEDDHRSLDPVFVGHQLACDGSLPVEAMVSSPSLCKSFKG